MNKNHLNNQRKINNQSTLVTFIYINIHLFETYALICLFRIKKLKLHFRNKWQTTSASSLSSMMCQHIALKRETNTDKIIHVGIAVFPSVLLGF